MEINRNCPYCIEAGKTPDLGRHLYINTKKKLMFCHRCNYTGKWNGVGLPGDMKTKKSELMKIDITLFKHFIYLNEQQSRVYEYCLARLPKEVVDTRVGWSSKIPNRAVFPVWDSEDRTKLSMWQARTVEPGKKPKYLSSGPKSQYVFNLENAEDYCVLTEGPFDALASPNGVCIFGKHPSDIQLRLLLAKFDTIYWALDPETQGEIKLEETKKTLKRYIKVIDVPLTGTEDPSSVGFEEMHRRIGDLK